MTPEQHALARHALGLPNDLNRSYRNRYIAAAAGETAAIWWRLVDTGDAELLFAPHKVAGTPFRLTRQGALAALLPGERLDPEDFSPEPSASAIAEATS